MTSASGDTLTQPAPSRTSRHRMPRWLRFVLVFLPLAALVLAFELVRRQLQAHSFHDIVMGVRETPLSNLLLGVLATAAAYLALTGYDWLALRYIESSLPYGKSAPISLLSYSVANALGFPLFTSTPIRLRLYSAEGLDTFQVVRVISFTTVTFWLGLLSLSGGVLVGQASTLARAASVAPHLLRSIGVALLAFPVAYLVAVFVVKKPLRLWRWQFPMPSPAIACGQLLTAMLDWVLTATIFWVLLPDHHGMAASTFLGFYLLSQLLALISHVPGGLGVFEASILSLLGPTIEAPEVAVAMLLFRALYYLFPLLLAAIGLVLTERTALTRAAREMEVHASPVLGMVVPRVVAVATFLAGAVLLISGSIPALSGRLAILDRLVPLGFLETSHLLSGVLGLLLLILANGLRRRLDGAWHVTIWVLIGGIVFALLRGLDFEEASLLAIVLVLLLLSKRHFYRKASLLSRPFSPEWLLAMAVVLACGIWLGLIAHGNADYSQDRLWHFSLNGDVPRFLRAQVAILVSLFVFGLLRLFRGADPTAFEPPLESRADVEAIVAGSPRTLSTLALLPDKNFIFDDARRGFIMYGISGDSWISMGDPVGPAEVVPELVWGFREACDLYDERPVFYQIGSEYLPVYLEAGLSILKLGESAVTPLEDFDLEGRARKDLRNRLRRGEREELSFEVANREQVPELLSELRLVSDEWLADKSTAEKSFSLGCFDEDYLRHFPIALVLRRGRILAFANLLRGAGGEELSIDLMRYRNESPPGVMDYLFVQVMLWGRDHGYRSFHLGMTPLAGLESHPLAPVWNRLGAWMFRHGEHFYNFQGLRSYKEKFDPIWEPRYLAAPHGLATTRALLDVSVLISGGVRGLISR